MKENTNNSRFSAQAAVEKFFSECESKFRFIEQNYNFSYLCGLVEHKNNCKIIKPYRGQALEETFWALTRYEKQDTAFEISFDGKLNTVECMIYYGPIQRFSLTEILIAGRKSSHALSKKSFPNLKSMDQNILHIAQNIHNNIEWLQEPSAKMIARALTIRHTRLETAIRKNFAERLKALAFSAARAYREKNYRHVINLLEPHKNYLASAELKKLHLAKKQLLS